MRGDDLLCAEPVLHRHQRGVGEVPGEPRGEAVEVGALARQDHEVCLGQRARVVGGGDARREVGAARDAQAVALERLRVLGRVA